MGHSQHLHISTPGGRGQPGSLSIEQLQGKAPSHEITLHSPRETLLLRRWGTPPQPQMQVFLIWRVV